MYSENMKACLMFANVTAVLRKTWPRVSGCSFFFLSGFFVSFSMHEWSWGGGGGGNSGGGGGGLTLSDYYQQVKMVGSPIPQPQIIFKAPLN